MYTSPTYFTQIQIQQRIIQKKFIGMERIGQIVFIYLQLLTTDMIQKQCMTNNEANKPRLKTKLAKKHNRFTENPRKIITETKVVLCRISLSLLEIKTAF